MRTFSKNHKPLPELDIDPSDLPHVAHSARQLPGVSDAEARGLVGFIVGAQSGLPDPSSGTAAKYRAILKRLDELGQLPPPPAPDGDEIAARRRRRTESGFAELGLVGALGVGAAVGLASPVPPPAKIAIALLSTLCQEDDEAAGDELPWAA